MTRLLDLPPLTPLDGAYAAAVGWVRIFGDAPTVVGRPPEVRGPMLRGLNPD
jgi:hypothetical protein